MSGDGWRYAGGRLAIRWRYAGDRLAIEMLEMIGDGWRWLERL